MSALGAALLGSASAARTVADGLEPGDYYRNAHATVHTAVVELLAAGELVDTVTVTDWLARRDRLDEVGGAVALYDLTAATPTASNVAHYVGIVRRCAVERRQRDAAVRFLNAAPDTRGEAAAALTAALDEPAGPRRSGPQVVGGGAFVLDQPEGVPAVWGDGHDVAWSQGEPLLLVGPPGVGKTTLAQQLVLARIGVRGSDVLGLPVADDGRPVLYLAMDRPAQVARSLRRMVTSDDRDRLDERLRAWPGPLPFDVTADPTALARFVTDHGAGTVVIDSLKDAAVDLAQPEVGSAVNAALQGCVAADVEVLALHHQRKATDGNRRPSKLADVFGSTWLTAGAGSVLLLWGDAGDPVVDLTHLKQPAELVGPWQVLHDHDTGTSQVLDAPDALTVLRNAPKGVTARTLAQALTGNPDPSRSDIERARRRLDALTRNGHAHKQDGDPLQGRHALYLAAAPEHLT